MRAAALSIVPHVSGVAPYLHVTVRMTDGNPTGFAATLLAGWQSPPDAALEHLRVTVEGIDVRDPLKPAASSTLPPPPIPTPPGWKLRVGVNGEWREVPGLEAVAASGSFAPGAAVVFDQWLPADGALRIQGDGSSLSCSDLLLAEPLGADLARFGQAGAALCIGTRREPDAGAVDATFPGPSFGAGDVALWSARTDPPACFISGLPCAADAFCSQVLSGDRCLGLPACAASGAPCATDADCGAGDRCVGPYRLNVRIERVGAQ